MPRDWKQIPIDDILNYGEANTGQMAQYERMWDGCGCRVRYYE